MKSFLEEFKTFAIRGNVIDLAIGVVIGAAFNQITTSLVNNILTPPLGALMGGINFETLTIPLWGTAVIGYGVFLQALINFILIAFTLFLVIKAINRFSRKQKEEEKKPSANSELKVLMEIRDELKNK